MTGSHSLSCTRISLSLGTINQFMTPPQRPGQTIRHTTTPRLDRPDKNQILEAPDRAIVSVNANAAGGDAHTFVPSRRRAVAPSCRHAVMPSCRQSSLLLSLCCRLPMAEVTVTSGQRRCRAVAQQPIIFYCECGSTCGTTEWYVVLVNSVLTMSTLTMRYYRL